jgi:hypothetical protein
MSMPQHHIGHVGAIHLDFCEGPPCLVRRPASFTNLGNILCILDDPRLRETEPQSFGSEGP